MTQTHVLPFLSLLPPWWLRNAGSQSVLAHQLTSNDRAAPSWTPHGCQSHGEKDRPFQTEEGAETPSLRATPDQRKDVSGPTGETRAQQRDQMPQN